VWSRSTSGRGYTAGSVAAMTGPLASLDPRQDDDNVRRGDSFYLIRPGDTVHDVGDGPRRFTIGPASPGGCVSAAIKLTDLPCPLQWRKEQPAL
jgi:hypothetical protein